MWLLDLAGGRNDGLSSVGLVISFVVCVGWLFTHDACMHPIGNGLAAFWAFVECPVVFVALFEEAGE